MKTHIHNITTTLIFLALIFISSSKNLRSQWDSPQPLASGDPGVQLIGFIVGPIIFFCSFAFIWANQRRSVLNHLRLEEVSRMLAQQEQKQIQMGRELQKKIVYISDSPRVVKECEEKQFGFCIDDAIKIKRIVEVCEYRDMGLNDGEAVLTWNTYNESEVLNRKNSIDNWIIESKQFINNSVMIGNYHLNSSQISQFRCDRHYQIPQSTVQLYLNKINRKDLSVLIQNYYVYLLPPNTNPQQLQVHGALRFKFEYCRPPTHLTIISGLDEENTIVPYRFDEQNKACCENSAVCFLCGLVGRCMRPLEEIDIIVEKQISCEDLLEETINQGKRMTNLFRLISFALIFVGIYLLFNPITTMLGYIPFFGNYLKDIQGYILLGSFITAIPFYLLCLSIAYLFYRPKVGGIIILLASLIIIGLIVAGTA